MIGTRFINQDRPAVNSIWGYYTYVRDRLDDAWKSALRHGPDSCMALPPEMRGLSVKEAFTSLINELEDEVTMALSSSMESCLRIDFAERTNRKKKGDTVTLDFCQRVAVAAPFKFSIEYAHQ